MHSELLSYVFFAGEFAEELIALGQTDAQRWLDEHPADRWQLNPLPEWNPAPNGDTNPPSAPHPVRTAALTAVSKPATVARSQRNGAG